MGVTPGERTIVETTQQLAARVAKENAEAGSKPKPTVYCISHRDFSNGQQEYIDRGIYRPGWYFTKEDGSPSEHYPSEPEAQDSYDFYASNGRLDAVPLRKGPYVPPAPPAPAAPAEPPSEPPTEGNPGFIGPPRPAPSPTPATQGGVCQTVIEDRTRIYGDPTENHQNVGLMCTAILQRYYGIKLPHPIPGRIVALMSLAGKISREAFRPYEDNHVDAHNYLDISHKCAESEGHKY